MRGAERLTERQRECLRLAGRRLSYKTIARRLGLSEHTVSNHIRAAREALQTDTEHAIEAVRAFDVGRLTDQPPGASPAIPPPSLLSDGPSTDHGGPHGDARRRALGVGGRDGADRSGDGARREGHDRPLLDRPQDSRRVPVREVGHSAGHPDGDAVRPRFRLWGGRNDLDLAQRLQAVLIILVMATVAVVASLAAYDAVKTRMPFASATGPRRPR